ncbi:MAG TPA: DMT family transporter [Burkholderiales bacterium]|nr:DMT family transporter [Burkholderiales bacterium]
MSNLMRARAWPYLLLVCTNLFWAGNWVAARGVRGAFGPLALTFWRWLIAAAVLAPLVAPGIRRDWPALKPVLATNWKLLAGLCLTGVILFQSFVYVGLRHTTAINGVLLNSTMPLAMMICAWAMDRDTVSPRQLVGVFVSLLGVLVIVTRGELSHWVDLRFNIGDVWILAAMPLWAVYSVLLRRRPRELHGMRLVFLVSVLALPLLGAAFAVESLFIPVHWPGWEGAAAALYIGLFASVAAMACWNAAVAVVGPNVAGFSVHLLPAFGAVLAMLFLGERPEWFHLWGVLGIFAGVALATIPARRTAPA